MNLSRIGWVLTSCFIAMTFVPRSLDHTLFVDGLAYASIARNMALDQGSFWEPYFAESFWLSFNQLCPFFCEHPPLMLGLQSLLFRLFGDSMAVENVYNLIVLLASVFLIAAIWRQLFKNNLDLQKHSWLPVLMWYGLKVVWWSVPNNLLDTTMAVFCMAACLFQLKAFSSSNRYGYWILAGFMVFLACMTKGPVGLFPLGLPILYAIAMDQKVVKKAIVGLYVTVGSFAVLLIFLMMYAPANFFLTNYFQGQVMLALMKKREKVGSGLGSHLYLLKLLFKNVIPHIVFLTGLIITSMMVKSEIRLQTHTKKVIGLTLLITISVIMPMSISVKQGDYYLMPALPFVGLFFGACSVELLQRLSFRYTTVKRLIFPALSMVFVALMVYQLFHQQEDRMYEVSRKISEHVPPNSKIFLSPEISAYSEIHTPFQRYARLSIAYNPMETDYLFFLSSADPILDSIVNAKTHNRIDLGDDTFLVIRNR